MDFCLDYKVLKQQILEDLKQLILIEKLFGEVPVIVLRYANVFGGQISKEYYYQSCKLSEPCSGQCVAMRGGITKLVL